MNVSQRIAGFLRLGEELRNIANDCPNSIFQSAVELHRLIEDAVALNAWFTPENVRFALQSWGEVLTEEHLRFWLQPYSLLDQPMTKRIGVVMAGNIPLVGFHDMLCVLISGHYLVAKTASGDARLTTTMAQLLIEIDHEWSKQMTFSEGFVRNCDAYIATGSNSSALHFNYYFGKYPHLIRHHRNGVAVLSGNETDVILEQLGNDVFRYFGLGCRNVSKLFIPNNFDISRLLKIWEPWQYLSHHSKYFHNYTYHKTIYLVNHDPHLDNGFLLLKEEKGFASPIAVLFYERYEHRSDVEQRLQMHQNDVQCVVSNLSELPDAIAIGQAQSPALWNYADGVDTMRFLEQL